MNHEYICIVCPRGCRLHVELIDDLIEVKGAGCRRGELFAREEATDPKRNLTTTIQTTSEKNPRLPVRTDRPISKALLLEASTVLATVALAPPIHRGDVIMADILHSGANIIASSDIFPEDDKEAL